MIQAGMPVFHSHDVAVLPQSLCRGFGHGHGAVPASGTAQSDGQTVAAFGIIVGQGKAQKIKKTLAEGPRRLACEHIVRHGPVLAGQGA